MAVRAVAEHTQAVAEGLVARDLAVGLDPLPNHLNING